MNQFKNEIKNYVLYDDKIKKYNKELKKLRQEKDKLEKNIINYMNKNDMNNTIINLHNGDKLSIGQSKKTESLSKQYILNKLTEYLGSNKDAIKIVDYLYSKRIITMNNSIKRKNK